jgi:hypothetical protein
MAENLTTQEQTIILDVNNDGAINRKDVAAFRDLISRQEEQRAEDPFSNFSIYDVIDLIGTPTTISNIPEETKLFDEYDRIMGLPPVHEIIHRGDYAYEQTLNRILQKSLVITLEPVSAQIGAIGEDTGLNLFTVQKYRRMVSNSSGGSTDAGVASLFPKGIPGLKPIGDIFKFAVQAENSFNESWNHDFGESMFENATNVGSSIGSELKQITGATDIFGAFSSLGTAGMTALRQIPGLSGLLPEESTTPAQPQQQPQQPVQPPNNLMKGVMNIASGSKVDFPMIWRGSSFQPNYSFTVKLWNPYPSSLPHYIKYILNPLYHLLLFMCPLSDSNFTYSYPVLCRMKCPGMGAIDAGFISNLDVVKGGDNNDISFKQRPGTVEVRFSIQSLYSTMIIRGEQDPLEDRPTLDKYMRDLLGETIPPEFYDQTQVILNTTYSRSNALLATAKQTAQKSTKVGTSTNQIELDELEFLDAKSDPLLNYQFTDETLLTDSNISSIAKYKTDLEDHLQLRSEDYNAEIYQLSLQDRVAIKIKNGVPLDSKLVNWFWNNTDKFDSTTLNVIKDIQQPNIRAFNLTENINSGSMQVISQGLSTSQPALKTGSF